MKSQAELDERAARQEAAQKRARQRYEPKPEQIDEPKPESQDDAWSQE